MDEEEEEIPSSDFSILHDTRLAASVKPPPPNADAEHEYVPPAIQLCPTMDLIAMVGSSYLTGLRVIQWERLFSTPLLTNEGSALRCIAFRPDGKEIAVGMESGSISIFGVETGE
jgi:hypothetical protein